MVNVTDPINHDATTQIAAEGKANRRVMIERATKRRCSRLNAGL